MTGEHKALVERLTNVYPSEENGPLCNEAARAITVAHAAQIAAEAERDEWKDRHFKMRDERDKANIAAKNYADFNHEWRKRAETAEAREREATALLRPFSDALDDFDPDWPDTANNLSIFADVTKLTKGDFARARAFLAGSPAPRDVEDETVSARHWGDEFAQEDRP